jgi:G3E family GTPase
MEKLQESSEKPRKCGIILLCGYLGAGKTTLIQYILKKQNKYKIAVVQNEYANEMGIESPLITDSAGKLFDKFYELPNGCICCSAKYITFHPFLME